MLTGYEAKLHSQARRARPRWRGSFRRAAASVGITPPAVSQEVRAIEAQVGAALFVRTTRGVGLTETGRRFLEHAAPAFYELVAPAKLRATRDSVPPGSCASPFPKRSSHCSWSR
jgi:DNA-binding transcriptional LysR family regulator